MKRLFTPHSRNILISMLVLICTSTSTITAAPSAKPTTPLTPIVLFTGWYGTKLQVTVHHQTAVPNCLESGAFQAGFLADPSPDFTQICQDKLLTMVYDPDRDQPMPERISNQRGVTVDVFEYGKTESAPFYEDLYTTLESAGYTRNKNIRVAGYDARLTPDLGGFLQRTVKLIERTYHENGNTPVHLVGHSNGPLYAQYLLTHTSQTWKNTFIHGFTPLAGNWSGQGSFYFLLFTGVNVRDFSSPTDPANARSSSTMYLSHPSSYMSSADPAIFGRQEIVIQNLQTGKSYTPRDNLRLFSDAGLRQARALAAYYTGFVKFADRASFPNVDVYAEKGSGIDTVVGAQLRDLTVGQMLDASTVFFTRDGDGNQEDITNGAIRVWSAMRCFRFTLTDNPGVGHMSLPSNVYVLQRLLRNLQRPKSSCS